MRVEIEIEKINQEIEKNESLINVGHMECIKQK